MNFDLQQNQTQKEWKIVFYICAAITLFGGVFYVLFCDATLQKWAMSTTEKSNHATKKTNHRNKINPEINDENEDIKL